MKKHIVIRLLITILLTAVPLVEAQQAQRISRIGYVRVVDRDPESPNVKTFRQGLRDLGYVEGKNIIIEYRYADGNRGRIPALVAELVQLKVDVIVSGDDEVIRAAKQATDRIPIVMLMNLDPVATGLIDSLARPGGNITGISRLTRELSGKRLELLKEVVPKLSRAGILWDPTSRGSSISFKEYESAASGLKVQLHSLEARGPNYNWDGYFKSATKARVGAVIVIGGAALNGYRNQIPERAIKYRLPSMYDSSLWTNAGGLVSYTTSDTESYRRAVALVDKILKGTRPADIPVEQPMKFEFVINLKTAKQIGLTIPPNVLARADKVIR